LPTNCRRSAADHELGEEVNVPGRNPRSHKAVDATASHGQTATDRLVRLSVNLNPDTADVLKEYAIRKGVSVTEAVRRAIGVLKFVDETQNRGASVMVSDDSGGVKEVMFLV